MTKKIELFDVITKRMNDLRDMIQNDPAERERIAEQRHLDPDTPERAYFHFGYIQALRDVLNKLEMQDTTSGM